MFRPFQHRIQPPRSSAEMSSDPDQRATFRGVRNIVVPIPTTIDLLTIPAGPRQRDFFLWQPYQNSLDAVYIGADQDVTLAADASWQLVQINGNEVRELTNEVSIQEFAIEPKTLPAAAQVLDGPVFLRVRTTPVDQLLFVTVHALTPEIP